jgi:hypothetical protein
MDLRQILNLNSSSIQVDLKVRVHQIQNYTPHFTEMCVENRRELPDWHKYDLTHIQTPSYTKSNYSKIQ